MQREGVGVGEWEGLSNSAAKEKATVKAKHAKKTKWKRAKIKQTFVFDKRWVLTVKTFRIMVEIMKAERFDNTGPTTLNSHPLAVSNPPGGQRAPLHPTLGPHQHHGHHSGPNSSGTTTATMNSNHQGSPLQRPPSTIHHQGVKDQIELQFELRTLFNVEDKNVWN